MTFDPHLYVPHLAEGTSPKAALAGINLVTSEIETVRETVKRELEQNQRKNFQRKAEIKEASFGGGDLASDLGMHHTRAYAVVDETLGGVETDLENFIAACQDAREVLIDSDARSGEDFTRVSDFINALTPGTEGTNTRNANYNAQQNPVGDEA